MRAVRTFDTPWGPMGLAATGRGVVRVVLPGHRRRAELQALRRRTPGAVPPAADRHARRAEREIREHLAGKRRRFTVRLDLGGLPVFQRRALAAARRIPYGRTATYGRLAAQIGRPKAARAVGRAMARNPVPLLVPCHRVTAAGGALGGFGGGAALKRRLLALENVISTQRPRRAQRKE
ncbi:MAG TPA: methylated-DNA--[protein]-cysteine S-methyltransferase [Phycisphaerae bacterium]|nr:methylated-DNA--[protein]-cysteine S-methyltransferase [Phycisphaerae bacterium]